MNADHLDAFPTFEKQMRGWIDSGKLVVSETIVEGLNRAPAAFIGLLEGNFTGKLIVKLNDDEQPIQFNQ